MSTTTKKATTTAKRSTTARKAPAKATTTRKAPAKRTAAAKPAKAVSKVAASTASAFNVLAPEYGYPGKTSATIRRSFTAAVSIVSGMAVYSPQTGKLGKGKGDYAEFRKRTAGKIERVWPRSLFEDGGAIAKLQGAFDGKAAGGYNAQIKLVESMIAALKGKPGKYTFKDDKGRTETVLLISSK